MLCFDRKEASETALARDVWVHDLRTDQHLTLKETRFAGSTSTASSRRSLPTTAASGSRASGSGAFTYDEIVARDKAGLDVFWLRDDPIEDAENLPAPAVIAAEIIDDLEAAVAS